MTPEEIERLRKFAKAAPTPRLWSAKTIGEMFRWWRKSGMDSTGTFTTQDGEYAASVVNAAPALLDAAERGVRLERVREAAAKLIKAIYPTIGADARARWIIDGDSTAPSELAAALSALEGGA